MAQQLLNTLYVQTDGSFIRLDHETVIVEQEQKKILQVPLHHLGGIVAIGRVTTSSPLLARCAAESRSVVHLDASGRFLYRIEGKRSGNVLLRVAQQQARQQPERVLPLVQAMIAGKLYNSRQMLLRCARDAEDEAKRSPLRESAEEIRKVLKRLQTVTDLNELRGVEGNNAKRYFAQFANRIKQPGDTFVYNGRTRRPPRDPVNALLSFLYTLLLHDCIGALEGVGLDPQIGYLHTLRPGRPALALDLMEEMRPILADRLALTLINRGQLQASDFEEMPGGAVFLNKSGRQTVILAYQKRKQDVVTHAVLSEKMPLGLVIHLQARLLARAIRKDHLEYQPFLYK